LTARCRNRTRPVAFPQHPTGAASAVSPEAVEQKIGTRTISPGIPGALSSRAGAGQMAGGRSSSELHPGLFREK
jgi:hypothetical protein